jgi:AcrR family transcriptional regulator
MADVLAEAGLSAGAVYRYFPSKTAIVAAIAHETVGQVYRELEEIISADPLPPLDDVLGRVFARAGSLAGPDGAARIGVQVWGEAMHDAALRALAGDVITRLRGVFVEFARRLQAAGQLPADADPFAVGAALLALVPGLILQLLLAGDVEPETVQAGVRALCQSGGSGGSGGSKVECDPGGVVV